MAMCDNLFSAHIFLSFKTLNSPQSRVPTSQGKCITKFPGRENTWNLEILSKHGEFSFLKFTFPDSKDARCYKVSLEYKIVKHF